MNIILYQLFDDGPRAYIDVRLAQFHCNNIVGGERWRGVLAFKFMEMDIFFFAICFNSDAHTRECVCVCIT